MVFPLIRAQRFQARGEPSSATGGLTFESRARILIIVGASTDFIRACAGLAPNDPAHIAIEGVSPWDSLRQSRLAVVMPTVSVPKEWSAIEYATWSARLAGLPKDEASRRAAIALENVRVNPSLRLHGCTADTNALIHLAAAQATTAEVTVIAEVLGSMSGEGRTAFARAIAGHKARAILFVDAFDPTDPMVAVGDEVIILSNGALIARGRPAELTAKSRVVELRFLDSCDRFVELARERGLAVEQSSQNRVVLKLAETANAIDALTIAIEAQTPVIELHPVVASLPSLQGCPP